MAVLTRAAWAVAEILALILSIAGWIWASHALSRQTQAPLSDSGVRRVWGVAEHHAYVAVLVLLSAAYGYSSFLSTSHWFGFSQVRHLGLVMAVAALVLVPGLALRFDAILQSNGVATWTRRLANPTFLIVLCVVFVAVALPLRSMFMNADGRNWIEAVTRGPYITNLGDQVLEYYVHYLFAGSVRRALGWDAAYSYQVLAVAGGAVFVYVIGRLSVLLLPASGVWLFAWVLSGGFMQLFFGDIENYSLVTPLMVVYLWLGVRYLEDRVSLWVPSLILAVATCFHLLTVFLGPSWLYLCWLEFRRRGGRALLISSALGAIALAVTFLLVHVAIREAHTFSLPALRETMESLRRGSGGLNPGIWFANRTVKYYFEIGNLLFLLVPQALVALPLLLYRRVDRSETNIFWGISAAAFVLMLAVWYSGLGVLNDWNVFAPMSIAFSIWCGYNFLRIEGLRYKTAILVGLLALGAVHSYSWIVCNHFPTCP